MGRNRNESAHVRETDVAAEADATTPVACLIKPNENTVQATEGMEKIAMHGLIQSIGTN